MPEPVEQTNCPAGAAKAEMERRVRLLGVDYTHLRLEDGSDFFLTDFGLPFREQLRPDLWLDDAWFAQHSVRLAGTSAVYRLPTQSVAGRPVELVVKWSRVGEQVPLDTKTLYKFLGAEFNSPFEEFSLVMALRRGAYGPHDVRIRTKRPLGIYTPSRRLHLWQTGRSEHIISSKLARNPDVELDLLRQYVIVYGWIKGLDLVQVADLSGMGGVRREEFLAHYTSLAIHELELKGFRVLDMKPAHVIVRQRKDGSLLRDNAGQLAYALVDYELLERTPEAAAAAAATARGVYLRRISGRFRPAAGELPPNLRRVTLQGVEFVVGRTESTGGLLFVLGSDPELFNYFLPERWRRTPGEPLDSTTQRFFTRSKDNLPLVWRIADSNGENGNRASSSDPFALFAHVLRLQQQQIPVLSPRAIYFPESSATAAWSTGSSTSWATLLPPLRSASYITVWGFLEYLTEDKSDSAEENVRCIGWEAARRLGLVTAEAQGRATDLCSSSEARGAQPVLLVSAEKMKARLDHQSNPLVLLSF